MSTADPPSRPARLPFAQGFPEDAALDAIVAAFERGDYARVRTDAAKLVMSTEDDAVRKAARELLARTDADPLARLLLVITGVLLVFLTAWWLVHAHPSGPSPAPPPPPAVERVD